MGLRHASMNRNVRDEAIRDKWRKQVTEMLEYYVAMESDRDIFSKKSYIRNVASVGKLLSEYMGKNPSYIPTSEDASEWDYETHVDFSDLNPLELLPKLIRKIKKADKSDLPYPSNYYRRRTYPSDKEKLKEDVVDELHHYVQYSRDLAEQFDRYAADNYNLTKQIKEKLKQDPNYMPTTEEAREWADMSNVEEFNTQPLNEVHEMVELIEK